MIAVMAKSGLRVGEVCAPRWRSVDTAHQRFVIEEAKTAAGIRDVDLRLDLVEELNAWRAERKPATVDEFVFATASGRPRDKDSVRERVLAPLVGRTNEIRAERGIAPLPKVTPHALRSDVHQPDARGQLAQSSGPGALLLGVSISLDELAIGFTLGLLRLPAALVIVLIAIQAFVVTQLGLRLGARLSEALREGAERLAGLALTVLGVVLLAEKLAG